MQTPFIFFLLNDVKHTGEQAEPWNGQPGQHRPDVQRRRKEEKGKAWKSTPL